MPSGSSRLLRRAKPADDKLALVRIVLADDGAVDLAHSLTTAQLAASLAKRAQHDPAAHQTVGAKWAKDLRNGARGGPGRRVRFAGCFASVAWPPDGASTRLECRWFVPGDEGDEP